MKAILIALLTLSFSFSSFATTKEEVQQKTADAATAAADYSKEQKEQFQKDMETKLGELKAEIADLKKQASEKTGAAKKEMNEQIATLEKKQKDMKKDLAKLGKSSGQAWAEMKVGMSKAWDSLSESYAKAKTKFQEEK